MVLARLIAFAIAVGLAGTAFAADHLTPENSTFGGDDYLDDYASLVTTVLKAAYERDVTLRVIVIPSFRPEYAVGIRTLDTQHYRIFSLEPSVHLWTTRVATAKEGELRVLTAGSARPEPVAIKRCEVNIDAELGEKIAEVWRAMLLQTRFETPKAAGARYRTIVETVEIRGDGVTYHFSMRGGQGTLAGQAWSPDEGTAPAMLVAMTDTMRDLCRTKVREHAMRLRTQVDVLRERLANAVH